jgi:predicted dehydrogenase
MSTNRREFIKKASAGALGIAFTSSTLNAMSAASYRNIIGSNERINIAIQGLGRRLGGFMEPIGMKENNVKLLYLCDVMKSQREKALENFSKFIDYKPTLENDIRKVLADKNLDAVIIATPDHWHTPGACMAMQAGKHVYLEKPCSHNPHENELVVAFQKKYNKVVQMGNQQRSSNESNEIINAIHNGIIGKAYKAIAFYTNSRGPVPVPVKAAPPEGLDWDLFQGPSPRKEYMHDTWDYNWHWYGWDFGTAEMGNNATHELDIARWAMNVEYPMHVDVFSGKFHYPNDGWTMYDTMEANFHFEDNRIIQWDGQSRNAYNKYGKSRGTLIYGSEGSVMTDRDGYTVFDLTGKVIKENINVKGSESGITLGGSGNLSTLHVNNFMDTIRGKSKLTSPIEVGAISQMLTHYANISSRIGKSFAVDTKNGRIKDDEAMKLWSREYEKGWEPKL